MISEEVWEAALGAPPVEPPLPPNPENPFDGYDVRRPREWPTGSRRPADSYFWFEYHGDRLPQGSTVEEARLLGDKVQRDLVTRRIQTIALQPNGETHPIPVEVWQANNDRGANVRWSGA